MALLRQVEEYENFVASRPSCYINEANPSAPAASTRNPLRCFLHFLIELLAARELFHVKHAKQKHRHEHPIWLHAHDYAVVAAIGSEIAGEAAAGLAAAYIVLGANKAVSATTLSSYLTHAEQLYTLATTYQGSYQTLTNDPCLKQLGVRVTSRKHH